MARLWHTEQVVWACVLALVALHGGGPWARGGAGPSQGVAAAASTTSTSSARNAAALHPGLRAHFSAMLRAYTPLHREHVRHRRQATPLGDLLRITVPIEGRPVILRLHQDHSLFTGPFSAVAVGEGGVERPILVDKSVFFAGTVEGTSESVARVHVRDGVLSGSVRIGHDLYMIEPVANHARFLNVTGVMGDDAHPDMIVYNADDMVWPGNHPAGPFATRTGAHSGDSGHSSERPEYCSAHKLVVPPDHPPVDLNGTMARRRRAISANENTCNMALLADFRFFSANGADEAFVAELLVQFLSFVDANFRATAFDAQTSNVGLAVSRITIFTTSGSDPFFQPQVFGVDDLLRELSKTDFRDVCLAHLFTHQDFDQGVQGLAWVANTANSGICDGFGQTRSFYFNTGLTTGLNHGANLLQLMLMLVLQHEIGHNFGSPHDPDNAECAPIDNRFVMFFSAVDGSATNNLKFSSCSREKMLEIINLRAPVCFTAIPKGACGNSRVEPFGADGVDDSGAGDDEQCDAGLIGDDCCDTSCKLRAGAECSDANSRCCRDCQRAGAVLDGSGGVITPAKQCFQEFAKDPECRADTFCTNASLSCPTLALKADGAECINSGFCRPTATPPESICTSVCALPELGAKACSCEAGTADECRICCEDDPEWCPTGFVFEARTHDTNGTSLTACFDRDTTGWNDTTVIPTANHAFTTTCQAAHLVLSEAEFSALRHHDGNPYSSANLILTPGTVCDGGLCGEGGECEATTDDFTSRFLDGLQNLSFNAIKDWMEKNIVAAAILGSLLIWVPACLCIRYKDKKLLKKLQKDADLVKRRRRNTFKLRANAQQAHARSRVGPAPVQRQPAARKVDVVSSRTGGWVDEYEC